jgi:hypothetical protein
MAKAKKLQSFGGVGESKNFGAPETERLKAGVDRILNCHIDGVLVSDLPLDPQVLSALDYFATDEGIAEKASSPNARPSSGVTVGNGPFEKSLQQRRDDVKIKGMPLPESRDPLKEVADKYAQPGMSPKFLSQKRVQEEGSTGIHEIVRKANGDPVMVKGMVLGLAPTELVEQRNEGYRRRGNQLLKQIEQQVQSEEGIVDR